MKDPKPENISGSKVSKHSVNWEVNVGYLVLGIAAIYVTWKASKLFGSSSGSESSASTSRSEGVDVEIEETAGDEGASLIG